MKDILYGILSAVALAAQVGWERLLERWKRATEMQKSITIAVLIIVVSLLAASAVSAENAPGSNFGSFASVDGSTVFMCYLSTSEPKVGTIYTCLVMFPIAPQTLASTGSVTYCTITNYKDDMPFVECGEYDDMKLISGGI